MNNTFLSQFLMMTNLYSVGMVIILVGLFFIINKMSKKFKFTKLMIISIFIGLALGVFIQLVAKFPDNPGEITWINEVSTWYGLFGNGFMDLLKMIVVPLVLVSIIRVIMNMKEDNLGKLTFKSMFMFFATTAMAAIIAVIVAKIFNLGYSSIQAVSTSEELREIIFFRYVECRDRA